MNVLWGCWPTAQLVENVKTDLLGNTLARGQMRLKRAAEKELLRITTFTNLSILTLLAYKDVFSHSFFPLLSSERLRQTMAEAFGIVAGVIGLLPLCANGCFFIENIITADRRVEEQIVRIQRQRLVRDQSLSVQNQYN